MTKTKIVEAGHPIDFEASLTSALQSIPFVPCPREGFSQATERKYQIHYSTSNGIYSALIVYEAPMAEQKETVKTTTVKGEVVISKTKK